MSRLYINLEGCVNTLRGECSDFLQTHGRDGDNNTAQSRFSCYYNKVRLYNMYALYLIYVLFLYYRMIHFLWLPDLI